MIIFFNKKRRSHWKLGQQYTGQTRKFLIQGSPVAVSNMGVFLIKRLFWFDLLRSIRLVYIEYIYIVVDKRGDGGGTT